MGIVFGASIESAFSSAERNKKGEAAKQSDLPPGEAVIHFPRLRLLRQTNQAKQRVKSQILKKITTKSELLIVLSVNICYYRYYPESTIMEKE